MTEIYFPFNTCEEPNKKSWVAQPISAFINMITCLILIYFFLQAKTSIIRLLILSFILFEIFHTFSHITHIDGTIQSNIIHGIWYFLSLMVLIASIKITKQYPNIYTILILLTIIIIDINIFFQANKLYMVFTALTLPVVIVVASLSPVTAPAASSDVLIEPSAIAAVVIALAAMSAPVIVLFAISAKVISPLAMSADEITFDVILAAVIFESAIILIMLLVVYSI
jgi:hypothetical protein